MVDKPPGYTSTPADADGGQSVLAQVERFLAARPPTRWPALGSLLPLHRLDKETSGVLMLSKRRELVQVVTEQFRCGGWRECGRTCREAKNRYLDRPGWI